MSDDRAAISAIVLEAMGDAWSDSEEYSALPGVVADLLLTSDWLAAEKAKWQVEALREYATAVEKHADMNVLLSWSDVVRDVKQYASVFFEKGYDDDR